MLLARDSLSPMLRRGPVFIRGIVLLQPSQPTTPILGGLEQTKRVNSCLLACILASFGVPALGGELARYRMLCEPQAVAFYDDCSSVDVYRCSDGTIFYDYVGQDIGDRYGVIYGRDHQLQSLVVGEFDYRLDRPYKEIEVTEIEDRFSLNELLETGSDTV